MATSARRKTIVSVWVKTHSMENFPVFAVEFCKKRPRTNRAWRQVTKAQDGKTVALLIERQRGQRVYVHRERRKERPTDKPKSPRLPQSASLHGML